MQKKKRAFTVLELLVVVVVVLVLAGLLLPANTHPRIKAVRINCVNNLKQVGLAFRLWGGDHNDLYPMQYFTNQTGALLFADAADGFRYFQVMSNELSTPKILICPADKKRTAATNFSGDFTGNRISYFVGLDANETTHPSTFLSGDCNITNGLKPINGVLELTTNQNIGWTGEIHGHAGNLGVADGSVQQVTDNGLNSFAGHTGLATNRLLFP
jgi:prepilin-type N-terminal cleavage/methylation domain-containing protein